MRGDMKGKAVAQLWRLVGKNHHAQGKILDSNDAVHRRTNETRGCHDTGKRVRVPRAIRREQNMFRPDGDDDGVANVKTVL